MLSLLVTVMCISDFHRRVPSASWLGEAIKLWFVGGLIEIIFEVIGLFLFIIGVIPMGILGFYLSYRYQRKAAFRDALSYGYQPTPEERAAFKM